MTVSCTLFDERLMDLVYNELDAETSEEMRTHATGCPVCGEALAALLLTRRMAAGLEMPIPPDEAFDRAILSAASEFARPSDAAVVFSAEILPPARIDDGPTFFEKLRALILTPAFATAAVALLVGVVTFFLAEKSPVQAGRETKEAVPLLKEALPSAEAPVAAAAPPPIAAVSPLAAPYETEALSPSKQNRQASQAFNLGTGATLSSEAPPPGTSEAEATAKNAARRPSGSHQKSTPATERGGSIDGAWSSLPAQQKPRDRLLNEIAPSPRTPSDYEVGMAAYQRGDCASAKVALSRVVAEQSAGEPKVASALHHLARCEKRGGQCGRAVPLYEQVITRYPSYPNRPDALYEAAQCRRRLGHLTTARSLLNELSRIPGWEGRANEALDQLGDTPSKARE